MSERSDDAERIRLLRQALTATGAGTYLATHLAGPMLAESLAAVRESDELELRLGRVGPDRPADLALRQQEARAALAAAIGAPFGEVVLAHGAADGARAIALGCLARRGPAAGRVVIVDGVEASVHAAVVSAASVAGVAVDVVAAAPRILANDVALVVLASVDALGETADLPPVVAAVRRVGARLLLDASLAAGARPLRSSETGADAIVADVHRWLLGPEAVALVWLSPDLGEDLPAGLAAASGPFGRAPLLATARSVGWLLMYVGLPWAVERTQALAGQLRSGLAGIRNVEMQGDRARPSALIAFRIAGWPAIEAAEELAQRAHAIIDPEPEGDLLRVSVGAWNTEDELERFVARVADLAASTPEALPRRPSLTILGGPLVDLDA